MTEALLDVSGLSVRFGGVKALTDVDLQVRSGEMVGLIGPNGAGKTTFIDAICGFVRSSGSVVFDDARLDGMSAHARARRGLMRTWQSIELFEDLTVAENLMVGSDRRGFVSSLLDAVAPDRRPTPPVVDDVLERFELTDVAHRLPHELSNGRRKVVGVARSFAANPHIVLLDEPAAGLDSTESLELGGLLRRIVDEGATLLLIDHDMELVMSVCHRLYVLDKGAVLASGTPQEISADSRVIEAYLGARRDDDAPIPPDLAFEPAEVKS